MWSYISSLFGYFFKNDAQDEEEYNEEEFLAEQLLGLEHENVTYECDEQNQDIAQDNQKYTCFQRNGVITFKGENYVLIDGSLFYDISNYKDDLSLNDQVCFLGYETEDGVVKVTRILSNLGTLWGDQSEDVETFDIIEKVIIGEVDYRENRNVFMKDSDLMFSLDEVESNFVPVQGDWLELMCSMQFNETNPSESSTTQVLKVLSVRPLRSKVKKTQVTSWNGEEGTCERNIYFSKSSLENGALPKVGNKVFVEAIESNQGLCTWRALKVIIDSSSLPSEATEPQKQEISEEDISLELETQKGIEMTHPLEFQSISLSDTAATELRICNRSGQPQTLIKWTVIGRKRDSQITIQPFLNEPVRIHPNNTYKLKVTCTPKFLGSSKELLVLSFRGFQLKRIIKIRVCGDNYHQEPSRELENRRINNIQNMKEIRKNNSGHYIPGVRPLKPPNFIPVRLGSFPIPEKVWSAILGDSDQVIYGNEFSIILDRIESFLPCLLSDLNIHNYGDKWHTLLYMEEIQQSISMRAYDMSKTYLSIHGEYLGIEIKGLSERRPSLICGDRVLVRDIWDPQGKQFEGYIHEIRGDLVLLKFNPQFQDSYNGSDVSVEFHFSRTVYRRCHQAINLAIANLGPDLLFPSKIITHDAQVDPEKLRNIRWFNERLNHDQKAAVTNILIGECRPMPYFIFGPPGTGKTVTVLETILQILTHIPDSRILVATPSNSAANLITERLLAYKHLFSNSLNRLIAHYLLSSNTLPDAIKPYCSTLEIATENTIESKYRVSNDGMNLNCPRSFVGRHRVSIGTCLLLGSLAQIGLPRGHFTHVIVDEAGQATEPEVLIPLTFTDKEGGQIILAGDPMQLGPVVLSAYAKEYGLQESYMSRILERFPYQKDYDAFKEGYDRRLVSKLNDNYRSLEEILTLPSKLFYDGSLKPTLDRKTPWVESSLNILSEIFETDYSTGGYYVFGIRGMNFRGEDSPSWYNPQEASMVALTTCKLYKKNISPDDIGIITPYVAQIKHLRLIFDAMGLEHPKIGTVEDFQGQERKIILISTVRSSDTYMDSDLKHTLGFVQHPKRLNVAITRAQISVLLFCNPHLLSRDNLWKQVISQAVSRDMYSGCDLPHEFS